MEELINLYTHIDVFLLVFCRIICGLIFLPITEESKLPPLALAGMSVALSVITIFTTQMSRPIYNPTLLGYTILIIKECMVGIIIGFGIKIFFQIYYFVGMLFGMQSGMSMSMAFDPASGTQIPTIGRLYMLGFSVVFIFSGGYEWFIKTLVESFTLIPVNQAIFRPDLTANIIDAVSSYWVISFKLAMPVIGILMLIDWGLGILARTVPQMNMFVIGIPLKMLVLFFLLIITIGLIPAFNDIIIDHMVSTIMNLLQGMRP